MANITTQTIRVDLSTGKVIPTAYTHQNDTARTLVFDMYNGGLPYTMTGNTVKFAYKSPVVDGQYSVIAGSSMASGTVSGNKVTVTLPSTYTAISGVGMLTMIITPKSGTVRPVNIRLVVQKSADGDDTVMGASDFPEGLYDYMDEWLAENEPTEIASLKSALEHTEDNTKSILTEQSGEYPFELTFINGRYSANGTQIGSPSSHSRTLSSTTAIRYDDVDFTINLKTGYMVAFPSFNNGVQVGTPLEFITTVGEITLAQIKADCATLGDSFAIMIRTNPEAKISPSLDITTAITKQIQMPAMVFNGALHGNGLTLSDYRKAGWYTLNSTAARNATDGFPWLSSNISDGVLQNFTNIDSSQNKILQRYTDLGSFKQAFERLITVPLTGDITVEDWKMVQTRLTLNTFPTITADIDITNGYTMGIYRVDAGVVITGASDVIPGYSMSVVHIFMSIMDSSGRFTYIISGTDGIWFKPTGTKKFRRLDSLTSGKNAPTTWVAIGDSITDGRYSYLDENQQPHSGTNHYGYYGYLASVMLGFEPVTEYGYGGMGWLHVANDGTYLTDILDDMDLGTPDLITVNLGVNDRNAGILGDESSAPGDGTISGAIRYCIETLGTKYKTAQIIIMTPLNACNKGSISSGWSKRVNTRNNLDDMAEIIKYWCNYYSIKCLDALNESPINVYNIQELLPDGLHPSEEAHKMIAQWLAGALPRRD